MNLLTRLNWEWRIAATEDRARVTDAAIAQRLDELADYLVFVDEATPVVDVTRGPGSPRGWRRRCPRTATADRSPTSISPPG